MTPFDRIEAMYMGESTDRVVQGWIRVMEAGLGLPHVTVADVVRDKKGHHLYQGIKMLYEMPDRPYHDIHLHDSRGSCDGHKGQVFC